VCFPGGGRGARLSRKKEAGRAGVAVETGRQGMAATGTGLGIRLWGRHDKSRDLRLNELRQKQVLRQCLRKGSQRAVKNIFREAVTFLAGLNRA
jgi:hypothetical protein